MSTALFSIVFLIAQTSESDVAVTLPLADLAFMDRDDIEHPVIAVRALVEVPVEYATSAIVNFEMQRQRVDFATRSLGDWEDVQLDELRALLSQAREFAVDPAPNAIWHGVTTSPIPMTLKASSEESVNHPHMFDIAEPGAKRFLFRCFDLGVRRGEAYRYRVRVEYRNPGKALDLTFSDWSASTIPTGWKPYLANPAASPRAE